MTPQPPVQRVLLVSDVISATQQISFLRPLEGVVEVTTAEIKPDGAEIVDLLGQIRPEILVMSRVTLPLGRDIMERARELGIPTVFHMDDNLLAVPKSLGLDKYKSYNHPTRLASLRACLNAADLVYVSTAELRTQLLAAGIQAPMTAGHVYCSVGRTEIPDAIPERSSTPVIGYMGTSGHAADLALVAPAIGALMDRRPELRFEIFGDLAVPEALTRHAGRVRVIAQTKTYDDYLRQLLSLGWWAGLAPLEDNPFNRCKADTKWVEYTRGGIPVVASDLPVYASACAAGTGRLAGADMAEWQAHIATLLDDAEAASRQVRAARAKLAGCYGTEVLRDQVMAVFDLARRLHASEEASVPDIVMSRAGAASPARATRDTRAIANVLLIANAAIPTLQLSFLKPLAPLAASGRMTISLVTETELIEEMGNLALKPEGAEWMRKRLAGVKPDIIVCCRYSGPHTEQILKRAEHLKIPVVFHIDDDLLNIPPEIGAAKHAAHNKPRRLLTVRTLLAEADLVYCSTAALERRLRGQGVRRPIRHGAVYCTSRVLRRPGSGPIRRIGYMGFDHAHDFEIARPAIEAVLDAHPEIEFELFGSIPMPDAFLRFGERARSVPPVRDYQAFLQALADREWDIGICPLARTPFNAVKANTKWIEYTASGMAVVASAGMVYDHCMRGGRGLLVDDDEWGPALELLIARPDLARAMAEASQRRLLAEYSETVLRDQVLDVLDEAIALHRAKGNPPALAGLIRTVA